MRRALSPALAAATVLGIHAAALHASQDGQLAPALPSGEAPVFVEPTWTSPEIQRIAEHMSGTWMTAGAVDASGDAGADRIVMSIAPVQIEGVDNTLFVEVAQSGSLNRPYRFAIFQLFGYRDGIRLRTHEIATVLDARRMLTGLSLAPEWFPAIPADELIPTSDIDLRVSGDTVSGSTANPFPTRLGGAVEMTSSFTLSGDTWRVADRGFDANGNVVWGASEGDAVAFERTESPVKIIRHETGVVVLEYANPDKPAFENDRMHVHYTGWKVDRTSFDSSRERNRPFIFAYPPGGRAIPGWSVGVEGGSIGTARKVMIPGNQAYAERGNPRAGIGPNEPLYFDLEIVHIDYLSEENREDADTGDPAATEE